MSIVTDVREMIGEATAAFYVDQQVYDAINEAQLEMWMNSKWVSTTGTMTVTANQEFADIPISTVMIPQYITLNGRKWFPTTMAHLEQWSPQWQSEPQAQPQWFVLWDASHFRMWPRSDGLYLFEVVGPGWPPTEVSAVATTITVPDLLERALTHRAAASLLEYTQPDLSDYYMKEAEMLEHKFDVELRNSQSHNIRQLKPGNRTSQAQMGNIRSGSKFPWYSSQY